MEKILVIRVIELLLLFVLIASLIATIILTEKNTKIKSKTRKFVAVLVIVGTLLWFIVIAAISIGATIKSPTPSVIFDYIIITAISAYIIHTRKDFKEKINAFFLTK